MVIRARAIEAGDIKIDVAFLGVPNADEMGNANGMDGDAAFGSLGYALMDAQYADTLVLVTDTIKPYPNTPASIKQTQVDYVVRVDAVGDPDKIGSGATRFTKDPKELQIAKMVARHHCELTILQARFLIPNWYWWSGSSCYAFLASIND